MRVENRGKPSFCSGMMNVLSDFEIIGQSGEGIFMKGV